jgi:predicted nucleic acid-binding Zn ribbon protein
VLASVQACWKEVAGPRVAAEAEPLAERDGVVVVACRSAVWAQELELLSAELVDGLNARLAREGAARVVRELRFSPRRRPSQVRDP